MRPVKEKLYRVLRPGSAPIITNDFIESNTSVSINKGDIAMYLCLKEIRRTKLDKTPYTAHVFLCNEAKVAMHVKCYLEEYFEPVES